MDWDLHDVQPEGHETLPTLQARSWVDDAVGSGVALRSREVLRGRQRYESNMSHGFHAPIRRLSSKNLFGSPAVIIQLRGLSLERYNYLKMRRASRLAGC